MEVIAHNMEKENREKTAAVEKLKKLNASLTTDVSQLKIENELCKQLNNQHWQTIAKQTTLLESKAATIRELEARIKELTGESDPLPKPQSNDAQVSPAVEAVDLVTV
jgi:DnaJ-domain-containing protein 1